jgi:hypothetical protein
VPDRAAFTGIAADLAAAARTLVVKLIKDKKTELSALRDIRTALGAETFNLIADGMADSQIKSVAANLDKHHPVRRGLAAASCPCAGGRLNRTNGEAEVRAEEGES